MNSPDQPTPRTDAAIVLLCDLHGVEIDFARTLERELTETERLRFGADADRRQLRCELAAAKAELAVAENWVEHHSKHADDLIGENVRLRAEVERWKTVAAQMTAEREHNANEASRLRAQLAAIEEDGTEEHNAAVGLRQKLVAALDRAEKAEAALADWSILNLWGGTPEIIHEFVKGQQNRIHHCQDLEAELDSERARLDYLALNMGIVRVAEALNCDCNKTFPIRDAIDLAMKKETPTP
jgi:cell division protein FtsB